MKSEVVLFLDFDGVLHPDPPTSTAPLFCRVPLLADWLAQHREVSLVMSSTWRTERSLNQLRALVPPLLDRILGVTPDLPAESFQRQIECEAWMRDHAQPWTQWFALDDRPWNFRPFEKRLILVERSTGIQAEDLSRLTAVMRSQMGNSV